jgi:hypothetical protein
VVAVVRNVCTGSRPAPAPGRDELTNDDTTRTTNEPGPQPSKVYAPVAPVVVAPR